MRLMWSCSCLVPGHSHPPSPRPRPSIGHIAPRQIPSCFSPLPFTRAVLPYTVHHGLVHAHPSRLSDRPLASSSCFPTSSPLPHKSASPQVRFPTSSFRESSVIRELPSPSAVATSRSEPSPTLVSGAHTAPYATATRRPMPPCTLTTSAFCSAPPADRRTSSLHRSPPDPLPSRSLPHIAVHQMF
jgi:hypothetical protein